MRKLNFLIFFYSTFSMFIQRFTESNQ